MRILLATAVAIAPLMAAAGVQAQTTPTPETVISTARTTPISTATATGTAPDNIRFASGGSIAVTSGAAVTVNSSHNVDLDAGSSIKMEKAANGATGILVQGGNTANVTVGGAIDISDAITEYTDTDKDGDLDGPFAEGTDRYGIRISGAAPLTGNVLIEAGGSIKVEGNNSAGVAIEAPLVGKLTSLGTISIGGENSFGVHVTGPVTGDVAILGSIGAQGQNAVGLALDGDVQGAVKIQGAISSSGYRYTTPPPARPETGANADALYLDELDADDLLQGGPAVRIAGDVTGGVLFDTGPQYLIGGVDGDDDGDGVKNGDEDDDGDGIKNREDTDRDGDGLPDVSEGTATIKSLGGAPAVLIGSAADAITLGAVGTGDNAYGVINRGSIEGIGLYSGVAAHGLQIGGTGQSVAVAGGVFNKGAIGASAVNADSTAVLIGAGASVPALVNTGTIQSTGVTNAENTVSGVLIQSGANVTSFDNSGQVTAGVGGSKSDAVAFRDESGTVTSFRNTGMIATGISPTAGVDVTGEAIAVDLSANTTGVTFIQDGVVVPDTELPDADNDGVPDGKEPLITGEIRLGSGADVLDIRNGTVTGDISFGAGADILSISGGAIVTGKLSDTDGLLDIDISKGTLDARHTGQLNVTGLNVGADGALIVTLDPANATSGGFNVNGTATVSANAGLGVRFNSLINPTGESRFTLIDADTLNITDGAIDPNALQSNSPYAFVVSTDTAQIANGKIDVVARRITAEEAGMIGVESAAYDSIYGALGQNEAIRNAILSQTGREGFFDIYEQMLPDHSGGPLLSLASGVDAVTRALTGRNASAAPGETSAWVQEINFYADKDKTDSYGFRSEGFGVAGGVERGTNMGAIGLTAAFTSSDLEDPEAAAEEVLSANLLELGLYWRAQGQYWTTWARAAGGYASFNATRKLVADGINLKNESDWHGFTLAAAGGASYERNFGRLNVRPEIYGEYFSLSEDARTELGGGDGFDLKIDDRDSHIFSGVAAVNIGYGFGQNGWIRPEVRLGWRQNFSVDAGTTIARFASGGDAFTLDPASIEGGGPILGFRLNIGNDLGMLAITGDAELLEDYVRYTLLLRASFKF
ncbi:MAG: autotransporter outer membrane beta-barrel domain-containing protein [Candidatus Brevundimonas phytovorans]|nr:autotransporter outer membrane beta-barrel domain-containing protein [Brevundimonas sp.]WEK59376.1 MAG: autotransporter outer membrane beta-barrel domain-containing protein [Brevundimonas sp.]